MVGNKWHETRSKRMDSLFKGKKYDVVQEVKSDTPLTTPLGYKINKGYLLKDSTSGEEIYVGKSLLNQLAEKYQAVEKPQPKKRGRPAKETAEIWDSRELPEDAQQLTQAGHTYVNPNDNQHL